MIPRLVLTLGEPAGIGPDIALKIASQPFPAEIVIVGSPALLEERAKLLGTSIELTEFSENKAALPNGLGKLTIVPLPLAKPSVPRQLNVANSEYVLKTLQVATTLCLQKKAQALITCPVHKAIIQQSGIAFSGHTEYLAELAGVKEVLMTFYTPTFLVGLATTHCALKAVPSLLTEGRLESAIKLLHEGLIALFQKPHPKIGICGLNPHAGESGLLGTEEQDFMIPLIARLNQKGFHLEGPLPADTAFTEKKRQHFDAILAMYHDQGLAPIKALFFGETVNMTWGLPFLRTSVDHGTALDLAGSGKADPLSLSRAIALTIRLAIAKSLTEKESL